WRTMIEPAGTSWPSPTLTPRRWPTESRPFFELEPAFLWAIRSYSSFLGARFGLAAVLLAGFASAAPLWVLARGVVGFFVVSALAFFWGPALAVDVVVGFAAFASAFAGVFGAADLASFAANAASSAA